MAGFDLKIGKVMRFFQRGFGATICTLFGEPLLYANPTSDKQTKILDTNKRLS